MKYKTFILFFTLFFTLGNYANAQTTIPTNAVIYLPVLKLQLSQIWPTITQPQDLAGQIEQETCIVLTWPSCWNPQTQFKTNREYGFGLGQLTITPYFNGFTALQQMEDPVIKTWTWSDRFNPTMQIRAQIDMDLVDYNYYTSIALTPEDNFAFMLSAYNGGPGLLWDDIKYCQALPDCLHRVWFNNVETHSVRTRLSLDGSVYGGQSAFSINRTYVRNILKIRSQKYIPFFTNTK